TTVRHGKSLRLLESAQAAAIMTTKPSKLRSLYAMAASVRNQPQKGKAFRPSPVAVRKHLGFALITPLAQEHPQQYGVRWQSGSGDTAFRTTKTPNLALRSGRAPSRIALP